MFVVTLRFSTNRDAAARFMAGHNAWLKQGFSEGVFALAGSIVPAAGGAILAHGEPREALERRIAEDPFVAEGVVSAEILEIQPGLVDPRLVFLKETS